MSRWIDITDDVSKKYYNAFTQQVEMPEYVKSAEVLTADAAEHIPQTAFADSFNKKFAVDSKANCWCSALYFYGNQCNNFSASKQAEQKLLNAARIWGISNDVERIKRSFEEQTIPVSYAMSFDYKGVKVERCPDHTKEAATASAEWLYANRLKFPTSVQKQAAERLLAKADSMKIGTQAITYLDRLANSDSYANLNCKIAMAITDRLSAIQTYKWSELEDEMLKAANDLNAAPYDICHNGSVFVSALEALDVKHGLNTKWGSQLQHPVDVCYRTNMTKAAAIADSTVHLTTGTPIDLSKISDHQLEKGLKIAGDDFLSYCQTDGLNVDRSKAAEILPTLPKPEAYRFETAVKSAGYVPESATGLLERLFKESNFPAQPAMMPPTAPAAMADAGAPQDSMAMDELPQPMPGEDDSSFEQRMNEMKEQARLATLDAQAGIAAAKARQARQMNAAQQPPQVAPQQ
jgi:hypothetical protein